MRKAIVLGVATFTLLPLIVPALAQTGESLHDTDRNSYGPRGRERGPDGARDPYGNPPSLSELREEYRQRSESEFRRGPGSPLDLRPLPVPVPLPNQRRTR